MTHDSIPSITLGERRRPSKYHIQISLLMKTHNPLKENDRKPQKKDQPKPLQNTLRHLLHNRFAIAYLKGGREQITNSSAK